MKNSGVRYGIAIAAIAAVLLVHLPLRAAIHDHRPFMGFFISIPVVAWFGGFGPSVLATALGYLAAEFFLIHHGQLLPIVTSFEFSDFAAYLTIASTTVVLGRAMHGARDRAIGRQIELEREIGNRMRAEEALRGAQEQLEQRVRERTAELNRAVETQERERRQFAAVLDRLPVCVALFTPDHHVLFENRMGRGRFGESRGRRCFEYMFGQRNAPCEFCETYRVLETKAPHQWECTAPDGRQYQVFDFPFAGEDGSSALILEVSVDITTSKQTQARLKEQAALLQLAHDAITVTDLEGRISFWNRGAEETYGWRADEAMGRNIHELLQTRFPFPLEKIGAKLREQEQWTGELTYIIRNGEAITVASRWSLQRNEEGTPVAVLEINRDVTQHKRVEEELNLSRRRLALAAKVAHTGTFDWDIQKNINIWSPEIEALYGLPAGGFGGTYEAWRKRVHPDDIADAERRVRDSMETGQLSGEWRAVWPDGSIHWLEARGWVFKDESGKPARMIGINLDITEAKKNLRALRQSEAEVRRMVAELEQRVRERTAQLEAANKELEAFAYSVSHDLRAPLRGIDGWSLALLEDYGGHLDGNACQYLDRVRSETQRMGKLIDDLLQLSRITRAELQRAPVNLAALGQRIAKGLQEAHPNRQIEFLIRPGLAADGDVTLLEVALTNLLDNAVKFTGRRAQARIELGQTEDRGRPAYYVRDNGAGFDMTYAATLFGAFQRLHKASEFPGTGIGLATVQRIIHRHGGTVWAEAQPDKGATFYFTIGDPENATENHSANRR